MEAEGLGEQGCHPYSSSMASLRYTSSCLLTLIPSGYSVLGEWAPEAGVCCERLWLHLPREQELDPPVPLELWAGESQTTKVPNSGKRDPEQGKLLMLTKEHVWEASRFAREAAKGRRRQVTGVYSVINERSWVRIVRKFNLRVGKRTFFK